MGLTLARAGGAAAWGVTNEMLAQFRDGKLMGGGMASEDRRKIYVGVITLSLVAIPLWASREDGRLTGVGEGVFDGFVALACRNTAKNVMSPQLPRHITY